MTREEAMAILEVSKHMATSGRMYNQAIDMAIEALQREEAEEKGYCHRIKPKEYLSADAVPTVIRSKTLMPTKDFKEWAKRIKEVNPNAVVIPCDAEVASADAEQGEWIEREDWNGDYYYDCSVCGESFVLCDGTPSMNLYHFCPNCGAKMDKGGDSE